MSKNAEGSQETSLDLKYLLDKYSGYRRAVHKNAFLLLIGSILLAAFSRSPYWSMEDPLGIFKIHIENHEAVFEKNVGTEKKEDSEKKGVITSGFAPILGPVILLALFFRFRHSLTDAIGLRYSFLEMLPANNAAGQELAKPPLRSSPSEEKHFGVRVTTALGLFFFCLTPLFCYYILIWDFAMLDLNGEVKKGYQLLYHTQGFIDGIWPSGHRGLGGRLPTVYAFWQPWLYLLGFLLLFYLSADALRMLCGVCNWNEMRLCKFIQWFLSGTNLRTTASGTPPPPAEGGEANQPAAARDGT